MKKKFFIGLFILLVICFGIFMFFLFKQKSKTENLPQQSLNAPIEIPDAGIVQFNDVKDFEKPVLTLFYVDWCTYCRRFMPVFGEIAKNYKDKYTFAIVNCDYPENKKVLKEYYISSFPSLFVIDKKVNFSFFVNPYVTVDKKFMKKELDSYLNLRQKIH